MLGAVVPAAPALDALEEVFDEPVELRLPELVPPAPSRCHRYARITAARDFDLRASRGRAGRAPCSAFTAEAASDLDEDGTLNYWGYVHPDAAGAAPNAAGCQGTGVWDPQTGAATAHGRVGPCSAGMGVDVF